ncbi:MAG: M28 family peptidase [Bacteroidetes bacterium]|nr:MAG: M28 family peptidase [Bacteroidota bacterium]TAG88480.1 MAG: M28 family peptidase [Bacteroidota bacterium]
MKKKILLVSILVSLTLSIFAQKNEKKTLEKLDKTADKYAKTINQKDLKKHLTIIASDEMEGRLTGTKGQKLAAKYISEHFKNIGLQAPVKNADNNGYYQYFKLVSRQWKEVTIKNAEGKTFNFLKDIYILKASYDFENEKQLMPVYIPNTDDKNTNALVGLAKSKDIAVMIPTSGKMKEDVKIAENLRKKGAKTIIFVHKTQKDFEEAIESNGYYLKRKIQQIARPTKTELGMFYTSPNVAKDLLEVEKFDLANTYMNPKNIVVKAKMEEKEEWQSENVLGFMEGTDKKNEIVVITSHYDHVGTKNGKVYNGADDDGSGTVSVLEIAEAFAKAKADGKPPRRSILFMTVAGEELGLYGSSYYADIDPIFPLENTVVDLNIDMVGRIGGDYIATNDPNYVYLIGSDKLSTELHTINEEVNKKTQKLKLDYKYNDENDPNRFYYRSDHYNFAKNNIPIIFYFNGVHDDYHQPGDDVEKIHFPKLEKIAKLIFYTAWEIANREQRIIVDKTPAAAPEED